MSSGLFVAARFVAAWATIGRVVRHTDGRFSPLLESFDQAAEQLNRFVVLLLLRGHVSETIGCVGPIVALLVVFMYRKEFGVRFVGLFQIEQAPCPAIERGGEVFAACEVGGNSLVKADGLVFLRSAS